MPTTQIYLQPCQCHTPQNFANRGFHKFASPIGVSGKHRHRCSAGSGYEIGLGRRSEMGGVNLPKLIRIGGLWHWVDVALPLVNLRYLPKTSDA